MATVARRRRRLLRGGVALVHADRPRRGGGGTGLRPPVIVAELVGDTASGGTYSSRVMRAA